MSNWFIGLLVVVFLAVSIGAIRGFLSPNVFGEYNENLNAPITLRRRLWGMLNGAFQYGLITVVFGLLGSIPQCPG